MDNRSTQEWQKADIARYLHPFTDHKAVRTAPSRIIVRAEGVYLWDSEGNRVIDSMAGLGCVTVGYGRKELAAVAAAQLEELSYCHSFFHTTNRQAIALAEKLVALCPPNMSHVFFAVSGTEANETAIRMVRRYWDVRGKPERQFIIGRDNGFHGSSMATASAGGISPMRKAGGDLPLPGFDHIMCPDHYLNGPNETAHDFGIRAARTLEAKILTIGPERVAAFIGEPIMAAGGAIIPPESYWPEIERICRKYGILLVSDEVVTGFGRTGHTWGMVGYGATPDIIACAKGITSAYAPLSAVVVSAEIADVMIESGGRWAHGYTYSGYPASCAVALANLKIIEDERLIERVARDIGPYFEAKVRGLSDLPIVVDARARGLFGGIKLGRNGQTREAFDEKLGVGAWCAQWAYDHGLVLRAIGDTMEMMPPLIITREQVDEVFDITRAALVAAQKKFM